MIKQSSIRALVFGASMLSAAVADAADVDAVLKGGFDFGGETLVTAVFTNGETDSIKANEGVFFGAGVAIFNDAKTVSSELTISWKYTSISADNGDIEFTRFPVDALLFYNFPEVRVGAGATYHLNPELDGSGVAGGLNVDFDNALGFLAQIDWRIAEKVSVGARYTALDYDEASSGGTVGSNGLGLVLTAMF
jgi:hypothetical protein